MNKQTFLSHEAHSLKQVIMCCPTKEYYLVDDQIYQNITEIADKEKAILQHQLLCEIISKFGADVLIIDELSGHPNAVFTRDTAVSVPGGYIKLKMGIESRRGEEIWMGDFLEKKGVPCIGSITDPGTVEGGDVILAGNVVFVGISTRTNAEGANQIAKLLTDQGFEVRISRVPGPFLHIGGAMSVIDINTVLSIQNVFPEHFFQGFTNISVPHDGFITGNVITLGKRELIVNRENVTVIKELKQFDFKIHEVDLTEFTKGTGGPSCLILPLVRMLHSQ
jgi:dimethylargininase